MLKEIETRRSIRIYSDKVVSDSDIFAIIEAGCNAPSARNQQPWLFKIIKDLDTLNKVSNNLSTMKFANACSFAILYILDKTNLTSDVMAPQDMSSCITMSLLEARARGIGSCWCGVFPREDRINAFREICNITNPNYIPFAFVTFGYPSDSNMFKSTERDYLGKILK